MLTIPADSTVFPPILKGVENRQTQYWRGFEVSYLLNSLSLSPYTSHPVQHLQKTTRLTPLQLGVGVYGRESKAQKAAEPTLARVSGFFGPLGNRELSGNGSGCTAAARMQDVLLRADFCEMQIFAGGAGDPRESTR